MEEYLTAMDAKSFFIREQDSTEWSFEDIMIKFAKYHVGLALKNASENAVAYGEVIYSENSDKYNMVVDGIECAVEKTSILNAYPLENIK